MIFRYIIINIRNYGVTLPLSILIRTSDIGDDGDDGDGDGNGVGERRLKYETNVVFNC